MGIRKDSKLRKVLGEPERKKGEKIKIKVCEKQERWQGSQNKTKSSILEFTPN